MICLFWWQLYLIIGFSVYIAVFKEGLTKDLPYFIIYTSICLLLWPIVVIMTMIQPNRKLD